MCKIRQQSANALIKTLKEVLNEKLLPNAFKRSYGEICIATDFHTKQAYRMQLELSVQK